MRKLISFFVLACLIAVLLQFSLFAQDKQNKEKVIKRVKPPTFDPDDTRGVFFNNVFADGALVGSRPADLGQPLGIAGTGGGNAPSNGDAGSGGNFAWKAIISAEVIEDEIKKISTHLDQTITTPNKFAGGGYQEARLDFSMLAMLYGISSEYDGDVRWKEDAPELRDLFVRAAQGAKVGSQQAYSQSKIAKQSLADLVRGTKFIPDKESEPQTIWAEAGFRNPLMQRLDLSRDKRIKPAVANPVEFKSKQDELKHEANIIAAIGEVLTKEGMEYADEEDFADQAKRMKKAAHDVLAAIDLGNYEQAVAGVGEISLSCDACHENYR